jgi:hypothetical protein
MWAMSSGHSSTMTILELNRLVLAQDARWADILTYAQSTRNPAAPAGVTFFRRTWQPVLDDYFQNVAGRYAPEAPVPSGVMNGLLSRMSNVVYPAARQVGLSDRSFLFPDITLDPTSPSTVAGAERYVDKNTNFDQQLALPPDDRRKRGISSVDDALTCLRGFRKELTNPDLLLRKTNVDITGYDLIVDMNPSTFGFGLIDDAHVATIPRGFFERLDAAAIEVGGAGFPTANIAEDQSADLIRRLGDRLTLSEFKGARKLVGTVGQIRQKLDRLIQLGEQKRATGGGTSIPADGGIRSAPRSISPIAIGLGVVGVLGVVAIATRH